MDYDLFINNKKYNKKFYPKDTKKYNCYFKLYSEHVDAAGKVKDNLKVIENCFKNGTIEYKILSIQLIKSKKKVKKQIKINKSKYLLKENTILLDFKDVSIGLRSLNLKIGKDKFRINNINTIKFLKNSPLK